MGVAGGQGYVVRAVRAEEWGDVKRLRLDALRDPVAHLAFLETYEDAAARPDSFWQERAAQGSGVRQFIAEAPGGEWAGSVTVLLEKAGSEDWAGYAVERRQGHVVGVFVRPEHRGNGLIQQLLDAGVAWAWEQGAERARLFVHADNPRAQGAYLRAGFKPTGLVVSFSKNQDERELEFALDR
ncbi:GNAT family N-acetyltransferase [Streptomyces bauhiniae]|uniref:GNAT family N-acetyltransferase n=1 Tax=Streptomyces bauhiniae TaxID=2340725 RepID=UPI0019445777|nr:GNAT family N-acetyltransferase [Streptomyces bauhiniae]